VNPLTNLAVDQTLQGVLRYIVPEAWLVGMACVLFVLSTIKGVGRTLTTAIALAALVVAGILHFVTPLPTDIVQTAAPAFLDSLAVFTRFTALASGVLLVLLSYRDTDDRRSADYLACLLVAIAGLSLVGMANDLIFLFLALELISIPTYVMLYLPNGADTKAQESAVKYFLLSIMSSGFLLFGFSYLYGITGTTNIHAILHILPTVAAGDMSNMAIVSAVMIVAGLGFKITAFPFHFYAPDVYEGGPTGTVALLSYVPKIAGFIGLIRLYGTFSNIGEAAHGFANQLILMLWILAAMTMTAGNVLAIMQTNVRRMLAYSGVAHSGYMLIGLALLPAQTGAMPSVIDGGEAVMFYLVAYGAMTIGAFAVISNLSMPERPINSIEDLAGLSESHPTSSLMMAVFLFSMIGMPATMGFLAKFRLFMGALGTQNPGSQHLYQTLAIVAAVNAAIAAFYYLRVLSVMYLRGSFNPPKPEMSCVVWVVVGVCAGITVGFGILPSPLWNATRHAFLFN
jgi:NADH-quinone oxidoreductase subunit N